MSKILTLVVLLVILSSSLSADKFNLKLNLEEGDTLNYIVMKITEKYENGEIIDADTLFSSSTIEVVSKNNSKYKLRYTFQIPLLPFEHPNSQLTTNFILNESGKVIEILDQDKLYDQFIEKMTLMQKVSLLNEDSVDLGNSEFMDKLKEEFKKIDSSFKESYTKDIFLKIIIPVLDKIDISFFKGMEIGEKKIFDTLIPMVILGNVKCNRMLSIKKSDEKNIVRVTSYDIVDMVDFYSKLKVFEKSIDSTMNFNFISNQDYTIARQYQIDTETGFIKNCLTIETTTTKTKDRELKKVDKTYMTLAKESLQEKANKGWLDDYQESLALAKKANRPIFIYFTGYTTTNSRWMERKMFTNLKVLEKMESMVKVRLYTDKKGEPYESNKKLQEEKYGSMELPFFVILTPDGEFIASNSFTRDETQFLEFLDKGLNAVK